MVTTKQAAPRCRRPSAGCSCAQRARTQAVPRPFSRRLSTAAVLLLLLGVVAQQQQLVPGVDAASSTSAGALERRRTPAKRSYDTHAYYVMETSAGASLDEAESWAARLGAELVEQVGELQDHWLVRAQFSERLVKRDAVPAPAAAASRRIANADADGGGGGGGDADAVMERYRALAAPYDWRMASMPKYNSHQHDLLAKLTSRSQQQQHPRARSGYGSDIVSLERQVIKQRVKRQLPAPNPADPTGQNGNAGGASTYLADLASRFSILDPLWPKQWHLANDRIKENSINVTGVWDLGITGKGVKVAIVDDGLDMHSNDLMTNFYADGSWDYNDHTDLPEPRLSDDQHGTRCAGEIAAAKNDVCGVGVAYNAQVAGIRILSASISDADEASALNFGYQSNDIYSCSWGPPDDGRSMEAPSKLIYKSMLNGVQNGRGGKGSIFVFASGNGGAVDDQCNFDGYTNSIFSITISAIDRKGLHPYYSEGCSANMVVTYSSGSGDNIHTTDVGENKCTHSHGGTSAAAPIAAGIFALALEMRPELTWRDLQHICVRTAIQVNENDPDWTLTHAGRPYNHKYGYGKLDAYRIVELAKDWELIKGQAWYEVEPQIVGQAMTKEGVKSSVQIAATDLDVNNFEKLEHVTVTLSATHERRGNVEVILESPNGVKSILARPRRFDNDKDGFPEWTFMSVKHWDEDPVGNWTLTVLDKQNNGKNGTFDSWSMTLWGSAIDSAAAAAAPYRMPNNDQIQLPAPPHHTLPSNLTLQTTTITSGGLTMTSTVTVPKPQSEKTKSYAKPTAHLPEDHGEVTGESDHPLDGLPTATGTAQPSSSDGQSNDEDGDSDDTSGQEQEEADDNYEYLGPWSSLAGSSTWFYTAVGSVVIFLGAGSAYLLYRRRRRQQRGADGARGWLGGYSTVSGADDGLPMSALERGRLRLLGGRGRSGSMALANQPGRTRALYDAFALSDSESSDDGQERTGLVGSAASPGGPSGRERRVDDSYMSSFLHDEDDDEEDGTGGQSGRGPRHSTPSPQAASRVSEGRYRDVEGDEDELDDTFGERSEGR